MFPFLFLEGLFLISLFPSTLTFSKSDWFYIQNIFQTCILPAMAADTTLLEAIIVFHLSSFSPTVASVIFKEHKSDWEALTLKTLQRLSIAVKIKSRLVRTNKFLHEVGPCLSLTSSDTTRLLYFSSVTLTFSLFLDDAKFIPGLRHLHSLFPLPGILFFRYLRGYNLLVILVSYKCHFLGEPFPAF